MYKEKFRKASLEVRKIIKTEKAKYIEKSLEGKDQRKIWRNLNELLGRKKDSNEIMAIKGEGNDFIFDPTQISETFNKNFIDSVTELKSKLHERIHSAAEKSEAKSMILEDTSESEVKEVIASLSNTSPGIDGVRTEHVKAVENDLACILVHLINRIIETATYPEIFKIAIVTPINKTGDKTNVND